MYKIGLLQGAAVAVFGLDIESKLNHARITWIMTCPSMQGKGIGSEMMSYAKKMAKDEKVDVIDIAASHLSAPFFERFGAKIIRQINNGWGLNMHRVDMELHL